MHLEELKFVELTRDFFIKQKDVKILEIGSYDVNGSIRSLFQNANYTGVDLSEGPGVDVVSSGHTLDFSDETFDITISCECFEHNPFWVETFANMHRMTKRNGLVIMSCASRGRLEHGTARTHPEESPGTQSVGMNYYRNLNEKDFKQKIDLNSFFSFHKFYYAAKPKDLYFIGWKETETIPGNVINLFEREIRKINDIKLKEPITFKTPLSFVYRIPLKIAEYVLADPNYQNFAIWYPSLLLIPRRIVNKLFGQDTVVHGMNNKN